MSNKKQKDLTLVALFIFFVGINFNTANWAWSGFYSQCLATGLVILSYLNYRHVSSTVSELLLWLSGFNFVDKILSHSLQINIYEQVIVITIIIAVVIKNNFEYIKMCLNQCLNLMRSSSTS